MRVYHIFAHSHRRACVSERASGAGRRHGRTTSLTVPLRRSASASSARDASRPSTPSCPSQAIRGPARRASWDSAPCRCPYRGRSSCRRCRSSPCRGSLRCTGSGAATASEDDAGSPVCRPWPRPRRRSAIDVKLARRPLPNFDEIAEDLKRKRL